MVTSFNHLVLSPLSLYTMSRLLIPTCGAARPTPSVAYITNNISLAILDISPDFNSSSVISEFDARKDGWGYFKTRKSVPSTFPGSTSSVADWSRMKSSREVRNGDDFDIDEFILFGSLVVVKIDGPLLLAVGVNAIVVVAERWRKVLIEHNIAVIDRMYWILDVYMCF